MKKYVNKRRFLLKFLLFFFWGPGTQKPPFKPFALAFESMAPAGAIDSNETDLNIPANSPAIKNFFLSGS